MGRKKLSEDIKKKNITFKLKPEMIKKIHEVALARNVKVNRVVEDCLETLNKE